MVFGRKKKQEPEVIEEATPNQEDDLALAYGNEDLDEYNDDSSNGDSVPPPPPGETAKQDLSHDDSRTLEDSPSIEANGVSMISDPDDKEPDPSRRQKLLLVFLCFASFCALLGLATFYGLSRADNNASLNSGVEDINENGSFDSPIADGDEKMEESAPTATTSPISNDNVNVVQETPEDTTPTTEVEVDTSPITVVEVDTSPTTEVEVDTTPTTAVDQIPAVSEKTAAPTIDSSIDVTSPNSLANSNIVSAFSTDASSSAMSPDPSENCVANEIFVSSGCENGVTFSSISICLLDDVSDQFWAWADTPPEYARFVARDWGWVRDGTERQMSDLPEGTYVLGLYSNGQDVLDEYPLITSTEFTITCSE